jgi:hypothetical protein
MITFAQAISVRIRSRRLGRSLCDDTTLLSKYSTKGHSGPVPFRTRDWGSVGGISYRYLREVERKQCIVEVDDDLSNVMLEIRRYEKNYLLYGAPDDLQENRRYIEQGMEVVNKISPELKNLKGVPLFNHLELELLSLGQVRYGELPVKEVVNPGLYVTRPTILIVKLNVEPANLFASSQ